MSATPSIHLSNRGRDEFVVLTARLVCERLGAEARVRAALQAACDVEGCVNAEVVSSIRPLTDAEWAETGEIVNFLVPANDPSR